MTLTVLFWNLNIVKGDDPRKLNTNAEASAILADVVRGYEVDVIVLAECAIPGAFLRDALKAVDPGFVIPREVGKGKRAQFITRLSDGELKPWESDGRLDIRRLRLPGRVDILLAAFHYLDRRNNSRNQQWNSLDWPHRQTLLAAETKAKHDRTVLFGDLNMNPFEPGMLDHKKGLGAMMTWDLAEVHSRAEGRIGPRFYNPMWSVMGRLDIPGTYYWGDDDPENPYWHCLDGVLVRPSLRGAFRDEDVQILRWVPRSDGTRLDLIRLAEVHWKIAVSDHLPILFQLTPPKQ